ncbi:hypothetical protein [Thermogemmatispora sp.]|uniref:hypothetical protein n=1 Tax=Thermogemmatispora sp. TaxID=1968838 RepID=UPI002ACBE7C1|nr:hypothetical protein [Thermogemmatispora sp.]
MSLDESGGTWQPRVGNPYPPVSQLTSQRQQEAGEGRRKTATGEVVGEERDPFV